MAIISKIDISSLLNILIYSVLAILIFCLVYFVSFNPISPDANLYYGLAQNLQDGTGYIDNIRNDEIIPTIGHPLIISFFNIIGDSTGVLYGKITLALLLFFTFLSLRKLNINLLLSYLAIVLIYFFIEKTSLWGVELSLGLSIVLFWFGLLNFIKEKDTKASIIFACCIFFSLLVRPVFMPLVSLYIILSIVLFFFSKKYFIVNRWGVALLVVFIFFGRTISELKYNDNRLLGGTYSEIPLYSAFNNYIDLERNYSSTLWKSLPKNIQEEAIAPLQRNGENWQIRAAKLKTKVIEFVINEPQKAFKGYLWRLKKFSFWADSSIYKYMLFVFVFLLVFSLVKYKLTNYYNIIAILIVLYSIFIQSVFPFAGSRYYLFPGLCIFFGSAYLFSIISLKFKK